MTREEAIERLERLKRSCRDLAAGMPDEPGWTLHGMALDMALTALRPVSRERVERMWPGCEACKDAGLAIGEVQFYGTFEGHIDVTGNIHYCPNCGRPITPIAKKKQEERLEVLHDD